MPARENRIVSHTGPVLHVVHWPADELGRLCDGIAANGTALALGIHSHIDSDVEHVLARLPHGNVYVNRNTIGAVVGSQPLAAAGFPVPVQRPAAMRCCWRTGETSRPHWRRHSPAWDLRTAAFNPAAAAGEVTLMPVLLRILAPVNRFGVRIEYGARMTDSVARLYEAVIAVRDSDPAKSRTARLLRAGRAKMAKKLAEEAVEVVIDAMHGQPEAVVRESADLLYNLVVLWVHAGVRPDDVWAEMRRREVMFGIAEKVPKDLVRPPQRRKVVTLDSVRTRKRR